LEWQRVLVAGHPSAKFRRNHRATAHGVAHY
jgi:hypothetical protein